MTKKNLKGIIKKILKRKAKKLPGFQKYLNQEKDLFPHLQGETPEISTKIKQHLAPPSGDTESFKTRIGYFQFQNIASIFPS